MTEPRKPDPWLRPIEAARHLGVSVATLRDWRSERRNKGPRFYQPSPRITLYRLSDLDEWVNAGAIATADQPGSVVQIKGRRR